MTINPFFHALSKHIKLNYHFICQKVANGVLVTCFIPSSLQIADVFTKGLPKNSFLVFRSKLGVHQLPTPSLRESNKDNISIQSAKDHVNSSMQSANMKSTKDHDSLHGK